MFSAIKNCFQADRILYTGHARNEMQGEDFGEISEREVCDAVLRGQIIARYPDDRPNPSCLIYGRTSENRPLHIVCAYTSDGDLALRNNGLPAKSRPLDRLWKEKAVIKCVICNSVNLQKRELEEEIKFGRDILLVPVDVLACLDCGERYYDSKTVRKLEQIKAQLKQQNLEVEEVGRVLRALAKNWIANIKELRRDFPTETPKRVYPNKRPSVSAPKLSRLLICGISTSGVGEPAKNTFGRNACA